MFEQQQRRNRFFSRIESREDAIATVKEASLAFFIVAGLQVIASFILGFSALIDAAIYVIFGCFLRFFNSRIAAVILLLLALAEGGVTIMNLLGANLGGGHNILLALLILWAAIRAVQATFKLHSGSLDKPAISDTQP